MAPFLSQFLRRQRQNIAAPYIRGDVLDLGCGKADTLELLSSDQIYLGVEGHPSIIRWLREHLPGHEFQLRNLDQDNLRLGRAFDTILMLAIIEHLKNPERVLSQIPHYLKPGGRLVITTPSLWGDLIHKIGARLGLFYTSAVQEHETIYTRASLIKLLQHNGLRIERYQTFLAGGNQLCVCSAMGHNPVRSKKEEESVCALL